MGKVKLPFIICKLQNHTEYEVLVADDRKAAMINSELVPSFYNDSYILAKINLFNE